MSDRQVADEFARLTADLDDVADPSVGPRDYSLAEPVYDQMRDEDAAPRRRRGRARAWAVAAWVSWLVLICGPALAFMASVTLPDWVLGVWLLVGAIAVVSLTMALRPGRHDQSERR